MSCKCSLNRPISQNNSLVENEIFNTYFFRPFFEASSFSKICYVYATSFISCLLNKSSPSAIFLRIIPVIINSINSCVLFTVFRNMLTVRFVHIISKLLEGTPKILNATTAIMWERFIVRVITSRKYRKINIIKSRVFKSVSLHSPRSHFFIKTSARFCYSILQRTGIYSNNIATITFTNPRHSRGFFSWGLLNYKKSPVSISCYFVRPTTCTTNSRAKLTSSPRANPMSKFFFTIRANPFLVTHNYFNYSVSS